MNIICCYKVEERTEETLRLLSGLPYTVIFIPAVLPDSYEMALKRYWGQDDLLVVEHDIIFTVDDIRAVNEHKGLIRAFNYWLYPPTTKQDKINPAHRTHSEYNKFIPLIVEPEAKICDFYGLGFTFFSKELQRHAPEWEAGEWFNLDTRISKWTYKLGYKCDILGWVEHNHK